MLMMRGMPMGTVQDGKVCDNPEMADYTGPGTVDHKDGDGQTVFLFCAATFFSAVYDLLDEEPNNPYLQPLLIEGVSILIWDNSTPPDVIEWIKEEGTGVPQHNIFQDYARLRDYARLPCYARCVSI